jgi:Skp family chaperone for outer membrane proteins
LAANASRQAEEEPKMPIVTYETVAAAAEAIKAEGGKPTNRLIQERLGGGSLSTVHKYLSKILSEPGRLDADLSQEIRPVNDAIAVMARRLHNKVKADLQAKEKALEGDLAKFAQELAKAEKERDEAKEKAAALEKRLARREEELKAEVALAQSALAECKLEKDNAMSAMVIALDRADKAEGRIRELEKKS